MRRSRQGTEVRSSAGVLSRPREILVIRIRRWAKAADRVMRDFLVSNAQYLMGTALTGLSVGLLGAVALRLSQRDPVAWRSLLRHPWRYRTHLPIRDSGTYVATGDLVAPYFYVGGLSISAISALGLLVSQLVR